MLVFKPVAALESGNLNKTSPRRPSTPHLTGRHLDGGRLLETPPLLRGFRFPHMPGQCPHGSVNETRMAPGGSGLAWPPSPGRGLLGRAHHFPRNLFLIPVALASRFSGSRWGLRWER